MPLISKIIVPLSCIFQRALMSLNRFRLPFFKNNVDQLNESASVNRSIECNPAYILQQLN